MLWAGIIAAGALEPRQVKAELASMVHVLEPGSPWKQYTCLCSAPGLLPVLERPACRPCSAGPSCAHTSLHPQPIPGHTLLSSAKLANPAIPHPQAPFLAPAHTLHILLRNIAAFLTPVLIHLPSNQPPCPPTHPPSCLRVFPIPRPAPPKPSQLTFLQYFPKHPCQPRPLGTSLPSSFSHPGDHSAPLEIPHHPFLASKPTWYLPALQLG